MMRSVAATATVITLLTTACVRSGSGGAPAQPVPTEPRCGPVFASKSFSLSGIVSLSPTTLGFYAFGHDSSRSAGYLLLVRGRPFWSDAGDRVGGGGRVDGAEPREHVWEAGGRSFVVRYDPRDATVSLANVRIALDTANVVLLERSDDVPAGLMVSRAVCAPPLRPDSIAVDLWRQVPVSRDFVTTRGGT